MPKNFDGNAQFDIEKTAPFFVTTQIKSLDASASVKVVMIQQPLLLQYISSCNQVRSAASSTGAREQANPNQRFVFEEVPNPRSINQESNPAFGSLRPEPVIQQQIQQFHEALMVELIKQSNECPLTHFVSALFEGYNEKLLAYIIRYSGAEIRSLTFHQELLKALFKDINDVDNFKRMSAQIMEEKLDYGMRAGLLHIVEEGDEDITNRFADEDSFTAFLEETHPLDWGFRHKDEVLFDESNPHYLDNQQRQDLFMAYCGYAAYCRTTILKRIRAKMRKEPDQLYQELVLEQENCTRLIDERKAYIATKNTDLQRAKFVRQEHYIQVLSQYRTRLAATNNTNLQNSSSASSEEENLATFGETTSPQLVPKKIQLPGTESALFLNDFLPGSVSSGSSSGTESPPQVRFQKIEQLVSDSDQERKNELSENEGGYEELDYHTDTETEEELTSSSFSSTTAPSSQIEGLPALPTVYERIFTAENLDALTEQLSDDKEEWAGLTTSFWRTLIVNLKRFNYLNLAIGHDANPNLHWQLANMLPSSCYLPLPAILDCSPANIGQHIEWLTNTPSPMVPGKLYLGVARNSVVCKALRFGETANMIRISIPDWQFNLAAKNNPHDNTSAPQVFKTLQSASRSRTLKDLTSQHYRALSRCLLAEEHRADIASSLNDIDLLLNNIDQAAYPNVSRQSMYSLKQWCASEASKLALVQKWMLTIYTTHYPANLDINANYGDKKPLALLCEKEIINHQLLFTLLSLAPNVLEIPTTIPANLLGLSALLTQLHHLSREKMRCDYIKEERSHNLDSLLMPLIGVNVNQAAATSLPYGGGNNLAYSITRTFPLDCSGAVKKLAMLLERDKMRLENEALVTRLIEVMETLNQAIYQAVYIMGHDGPLFGLRQYMNTAYHDFKNQMPADYQNWFKDLPIIYQKAYNQRHAKNILTKNGQLIRYSIVPEHPHFMAELGALLPIKENLLKEMVAMQKEVNGLMKVFLNSQQVMWERFAQYQREIERLRTNQAMPGFGVDEELREKYEQELAKEREEKAEMAEQLQEKDIIILEKDTLIQEQNVLVQEKDSVIQEKGALVKEKDEVILKMADTIEEQKEQLQEKDIKADQVQQENEKKLLEKDEENKQIMREKEQLAEQIREQLTKELLAEIALQNQAQIKIFMQEYATNMTGQISKLTNQVESLTTKLAETELELKQAKLAANSADKPISQPGSERPQSSFFENNNARRNSSPRIVRSREKEKECTM